MSDLLTAKDVEVKIFKKSRFGGYSVPEVEDFLNQVADDIEAYATQLDEKDARIQELESFVKKQEAMTDAIKDALIQARKAAKDMEDQAKTSTEKIIADAKIEAQKHIDEADGKVQAVVDEAEKKAAEIIAKAKAEAEEIAQASQERRTKAEYSLAHIEQELEDRRRESDDKASEILASAHSEAKKLIEDAEKNLSDYKSEIRFLSLQKQNFVKNTVSLLLDFGKIIDKAQQEIDDEKEFISDPEDDIDNINSENDDEKTMIMNDNDES